MRQGRNAIRSVNANLDHYEGCDGPPCTQECRNARHAVQKVKRMIQSELFAEKATQTENAGRDSAARHYAKELNVLAEMARDFAERRGEWDAGSFRVWLDEIGWKLPEERNFLGALPRKAGLKPTDRVRQSEHESARGRLVRVWKPKGGR